MITACFQLILATLAAVYWLILDDHASRIVYKLASMKPKINIYSFYLVAKQRFTNQLHTQ